MCSGRWGGARIPDRYRWAEWRGTVSIINGTINAFAGGGFEHPEESCWRAGPTDIAFRTDTYGDADSLVVNPHKWLFVPMDLSVFYCRNAEWLRNAFSLVPEYLRTQDNPLALNLHEYGLPLGRRFRSLKLWFTMRSYGRQRLAELIHQQIEDAKRLAALIAAHPDFEVVAPVHFSLIVFRHKASDELNKVLLDRLNATGKVLLSPNLLGGKQVIRLAIGNIQTNWADLEQVWEMIQSIADELKATTL